MNTKIRSWIDGAALAFAYFTLAPVRARKGADLSCPEALRAMVYTLPVVGLILGLATQGAMELFAPAGGYAPLIAAALYPMLYGYLHTEAVMDVADALYAAHGDKDPYTVIKDPTVGAMGALWGIGALVLKILLIAAVLDAAHPMVWLAVPLLSRLGLVGVIAGFSFRSVFVTQLHDAVSLRGFGITTVIVMFALSVGGGWGGIGLVMAAVGTSWLIAWVLERRLGFANGDVLGATLEATEIVLLMLALTVGG